MGNGYVKLLKSEDGVVGLNFQLLFMTERFYSKNRKKKKTGKYNL